MKKVLTILLCAVLAISFVGIADAAGEQTITGADYKQSTETPKEASKNVVVTLSIDEEFTVTIPANFALTNKGNNDYRHYDSVTVYANKLDAGNYLTVSIDGREYSNESGWYLEGENDVELLFGIKLGTDTEHITGSDDSRLLKEGSAVISTAQTGVPVEKGMHFKLLSDLPSQSGDYKAIIKFIVTMEPSEKGPEYINPQETP